LAELSFLKPEPGVKKVTEYGTEELRQFARGLLVRQCPECGSKASIPHYQNGRNTCLDCDTIYRPEDVVVIALLKAFQSGAEDEAERLNPSA